MKKSSYPHIKTRKQLNYTSNRILAPTKHQGADHYSQQDSSTPTRIKGLMKHTTKINFDQQEAQVEKAQL